MDDGGLVLRAPAKVNLHLGIYPGRDERGYHRADSLMVALDVCDIVRVAPAAGLSLTCEPDVGVAPQRNIAWKAAARLAEALGREPNVAIAIEKRLPAEAGLGGGSSDGGAVLRGLCELWGVDAADARVVEVARSLGADVPFFLDPRPTLLVGAGDVPERVLAAPEIPVVLVRPGGPGVSTPAAYAAFDAAPIEPPSAEALCRALDAGDALAAAGLLYNNLEPAAVELVPAIGEVLSWLRSQDGVRAAQVCGSGSCCFALCESDEAARAVAAIAPDGWWSCATHTIS